MSVASDLREDMAKTEAVSDERLAELIATTPNDPEHTITMFSDALHAIFTELLSRRAANSAGGVEVKVKPLEWEVGTSGIASTPFGEYSVQFYTESDGEGWEAVFCDAETIGQFATSNEAIAACQTDFNQRILSVLTHPSSPVSAEVTEAFKRVDGELSGYCYAEGPGDLRIRTNDQRLLDRILAALNGKE